MLKTLVAISFILSLLFCGYSCEEEPVETGSCEFLEDYELDAAMACVEGLSEGECSDEDGDWAKGTCAAAGYPKQCEDMWIPQENDCDSYY